MDWTLSAVEFDVLWRENGLGEPPYPLELESPGTSYEERAGIIAATLAALTTRGVEPAAVATALTVLAGGGPGVDGSLRFDGHERLVAARVGDHATLVLQGADGQFLVRTLDGPRLGSALAGLLPTVAPAHGQSVRLSHRVFTDALKELADGGSLWEFERTLKADGVRGQDVRWLAGIAGGRGGRGAQFGVSVRGRRVGLLSWHVTPLGGVLIQRHGETDWVTIAPSDGDKAVARLEELLAAR